MLRALLCEFDGVLAETWALRRRALASSFAADGLTLDDALIDQHAANRPTEEAVRDVLAARDAPRDQTGVALLALRADHAFAERAARGVVLAPGARDLLESAAAHLRLAVVTHGPRAVVQHALALAGLEAAVACVIGAEDVAATGVGPAGHRTALARLARGGRMEPRHALALVAGLWGVRAAHAAGMRAVLIGAAPPDARAESDGWIASLADTSVDALVAYGSEREEIVG